MLKMTIRTKILTVFLFSIAIISLSLIYSQYYFSKQVAINSTSQTLKQLSQDLKDRMEIESEDIKNILNTQCKYIDVDEEVSFDKEHSSIKFFTRVLEYEKSIHDIHISTKKGNFIAVVNMLDDKKTNLAFKSPVNTRWLIVKIVDGIKENVFLDKNYVVLKKERSKTLRSIKDRDWYKDTINKDRITISKPYIFWNSALAGITYAKRVENTNVIMGVDYTMTELNNLISMKKSKNIEEIYIVGVDGVKYISSLSKNGSFNTIGKKVNKTILKAIEENRINEIINYSEDKKHQLFILSKMLSDKSYIGMRADTNKVYDLYRKNFKYTLILAFLILLFALPMVVYLANKIAEPIKLLIMENEKIKSKNFSEVKRVHTNIIEIEELSSSLYSMAQGIKEHAKQQDDLLDSIIKLIAEAIDKKSAYTGAHCERVPELAQLLLSEVSKSEQDTFKDFSMTNKDDLRSFEIAAWLHDCGKVTTPVAVIDKSVKLEIIYNRIHEIRMRFEVLWRDAQIEFLNNNIDEVTLKQKQKQLLEDFEFIASVNIGSEYMNQEKKDRVKKISKQVWLRNFDNKLGLGKEELARYKSSESTLPATEELLSNREEHIVKREDFDVSSYEKDGFKLDVPEHLYNYGEVYNLCIEKGTLTEEERYRINEHVIVTIKMLEKIPFPSHMKNIVEYAGTHHETLIGTGYPRKLSKRDLSIPARIMAIADIYEALTSSDRPYKENKTISEAIEILNRMANEQHIDRDLFKLFLTSGIYKTYAMKHLKKEQIDEVDIEQYL